MKRNVRKFSGSRDSAASAREITSRAVVQNAGGQIDRPSSALRT